MNGTDGQRVSFGTILNTVLLSITLAMVLGVGSWITTELRSVAEMGNDTRLRVAEIEQRIVALERTVYGANSEADDGIALTSQGTIPWRAGDEGG